MKHTVLNVLFLHFCYAFVLDKIKILQDMINGATKVLESDNAVELVNNSPEIIQQLNGKHFI